MFRTVRHWWQGADGKTTARLFVFELFVVSAGVLIALGAEQLVSNWHWQGEVRDSDRRISDELGHNLINSSRSSASRGSRQSLIAKRS